MSGHSAALRPGAQDPGSVKNEGLPAVHAALGNRDEALTLLEEAEAARVLWTCVIKSSWLSDSIRADLRFTDLLRRRGLDP